MQTDPVGGKQIRRKIHGKLVGWRIERIGMGIFPVFAPETATSAEAWLGKLSDPVF